MLLRNYDNIMAAVRMPYIDSSKTNISNDTTTFGDGCLTIKDKQGTINPIYMGTTSVTNPFSYFSTSSNYNSSASAICSMLWCGSGTEKPKYDNHMLNSPFKPGTTEIEHISHAVGAVEYKNGVCSRSYSRTFKASTNITVNEIGVFHNVPYSSGTSSNSWCLVYHDIVTPKYVAEGSYFTITMTITHSANPNDPVRVSASVE